MRLSRLRRLPRDTVTTILSATVFSLSLGMVTVILPLLALRVGYSTAEVGILVAVSAIAQMGTRLILGAAMRLVGDWVLVVAAQAVLAASSALVVVSTALLPFVIAQILQGVARACFWTGSQTHVVRGPGSSVRALSGVNFTASIGLLGGPIIAGLLVDRSPNSAMLIAALIALTGVIPAALIDRLPPFSPPADRPPGRIWRRPGVDAGCWAGASAGAWRGLLGSYVPVALDAARQPGSTIGVLVSIANGSSLIGSAAVGRVRGAWVRRSLTLGCLSSGVAMALVVPLSGTAWAAALALAASGVGAGALQTVGPAVASDAVHAEERGEAIAAAGTFRAAALCAAPLAVAGTLAAAPLALAMSAVGALIAVPALVGWRRR